MNDMTPAPKLAGRRQNKVRKRRARQTRDRQRRIKRAQSSYAMRARLCVTSHRSLENVARQSATTIFEDKERTAYSTVCGSTKVICTDNFSKQSAHSKAHKASRLPVLRWLKRRHRSRAVTVLVVYDIRNQGQFDQSLRLPVIVEIGRTVSKMMSPICNLIAHQGKLPLFSLLTVLLVFCCPAEPCGHPRNLEEMSEGP